MSGFSQGLAAIPVDGIAMVSYSPTITAITGSFTTASASGAYKIVGKLCFVRMQGVITTVGTGTNGFNITLPFTASAGNLSFFLGKEVSATQKLVLAYAAGSATVAGFLYSDGTDPDASSRNFVITGWFELP